MNQLIPSEHLSSPTRQRVRIGVTALLGTRRFLALPSRVQNAIVPRAFLSAWSNGHRMRGDRIGIR